jgi:hypothetical protein
MQFHAFDNRSCRSAALRKLRGGGERPQLADSFSSPMAPQSSRCHDRRNIERPLSAVSPNWRYRPEAVLTAARGNVPEPDIRVVATLIHNTQDQSFMWAATDVD